LNEEAVFAKVYEIDRMRICHMIFRPLAGVKVNKQKLIISSMALILLVSTMESNAAQFKSGDFEPTRLAMLKSLEKEIEIKSKAKECILLKEIPAGRQSECDEAKRIIGIDLTMAIETAKTGAICLKTSKSMDAYKTCQANKLKAVTVESMPHK
jgi:hypothetical protein